MVNQYEEEVLDEGQQHGVINRNDSRYSYEHLLDENNGGEVYGIHHHKIIKTETCKLMHGHIYHQYLINMVCI